MNSLPVALRVRPRGPFSHSSGPVPPAPPLSVCQPLVCPAHRGGDEDTLPHHFYLWMEEVFSVSEFSVSKSRIAFTQIPKTCMKPHVPGRLRCIHRLRLQSHCISRVPDADLLQLWAWRGRRGSANGPHSLSTGTILTAVGCFAQRWESISDFLSWWPPACDVQGSTCLILNEGSVRRASHPEGKCPLTRRHQE